MANKVNASAWTAIPGQTTQMPVSVAQMGDGSPNMYVVYRGFGDDTRIWGTWWDENDVSWSEADNINGGRANSVPTISLIPEIPADAENPIPFANRLVITAVGTDNNIWTTGQVVGDDEWSSWRPVLGQANNADRTLVSGAVEPGARVISAVNENTDGSQAIVLSVLDSNMTPEFATFDTSFNQLTNWTTDTTGWQSNETPELTSVGNSTYSLFTGLDDFAYYKQVFRK